MSTTEDTRPSLYAAREPIFPKRVSGRFRNLKWAIMVVTLGVYYVTPWLRWDRGTELPNQAVLVDLANRRFFFFWIEIWPHEFYFVAGLLIMAGIGLFLFTAALGRVWCGYTCPQTVWTDLFILVERWIEGDRNARIRLLRQKWDARKVRLRVTKWAVWLVIAVGTGGAWVFYFSDAPTLFVDLFTLNAHLAAYTTVALLTATTFVFGGLMREQVCIYACPWPRIQAAMIDEDTITVGYRDWRGEPRGRHRKGAARAAQTTHAADKTAFVMPEEELPSQPELGDCIDCNACVNVCPMGIDIRDGQQLECITCALCIDACDEVMDKIGKPRGLIGYMALTDEEHERAGKPKIPVWQHIFRVRTMMYTALWAAVGVGLVVALFIRPDLSITVAPVRNPVYVTMSDGTIRNTYDVRLRNKYGEDRPYEITITSAAALDVVAEGSEDGIVLVPADSTKLQRVYVMAPAGNPAATNAVTDLTIRVRDLVSGEQASKSTVFNGRAQ